MADAATVAAAAIADVVMAAMAATTADDVATAGSTFASAAVAVDDFLVAASWAAVALAAAGDGLWGRCKMCASLNRQPSSASTPPTGQRLEPRLMHARRGLYIRDGG